MVVAAVIVVLCCSPICTESPLSSLQQLNAEMMRLSLGNHLIEAYMAQNWVHLCAPYYAVIKQAVDTEWLWHAGQDQAAAWNPICSYHQDLVHGHPALIKPCRQWGRGDYSEADLFS